MPGKYAIVLRGTQGAGKTTIARIIHKELGTDCAEPIVLDTLWERGQASYKDPANRYREFRGNPSPILVLELGWAEPGDMSFPGATRNPKEWIDILRQDGREVYLFRLEVDRDAAVERAAKRQGGGWSRGHDARAWWDVYAHDDDVRLFPERAGLWEMVVPTPTGMEEDAANRILSQVKGRATSLT